MDMIRCPNCDDEIPGDAHFCAACGNSLKNSEQEAIYFHNSEDETVGSVSEGAAITGKLTDTGLHAIPGHFMPEDDQFDDVDEYETEEELDGETLLDVGGQRSYSSRAKESLNHLRYRLNTGNLLEKDRPLTWHKEVELPLQRPPSTSIPPRPLPSKTVIVKKKRRKSRFQSPLVFWSSIAILVALVLSSLFAIFATVGHGPKTSDQNPAPSLQITPEIATIGDSITLQGAHFTPHGHVGLFRDNAVSLLDTSSSKFARPDVHGYFTDTIVIDNNWGDGAHTITAEDTESHKLVTYPIMINAKGISLRPPHLRLSASSLDLGSGDQATTDTRTISLINTGGGQITWQASSNQPWLQISPSSGTFSVNGSIEVKIAADRSKLKPGTYTATILFTSSAGTIKLPVKIHVVPFQPSPLPILQISPTLLTFSVVDGGSAPVPQLLTLTNPGTTPLHYHATTNAPWLKISSDAATINGSSNKQVIIGIDNSTLLPGSYSATVDFSITGDDTTPTSTQTVYVSVTVVPQCSLQVSPSILSFTGTYGQGNPAAKTFGITVQQNCSSSVNWTATSSASWLHLSATHGSTPANPAVRVSIANLASGTYHGAVTVSSPKSTQTIAVTLTVGVAATPTINTSPANLAFNGVVGQADPTPQAVTLSNTGGATMYWSALPTTAVGGSWLNIQPNAGSLAAGQTVSLSVAPSLLGGLTTGTYNGTIAITGADSSGNTAAGSPQNIPVTLTLTTPCTTTVSPTSLAFNATVGQPQDPSTQNVAVVVSGTCPNPVNWTAAATTSSGGQWLSLTSASGQTTVANASTLGVDVTIATLAAGNYTGAVTITPTDSVTHIPVGPAQTITISLNMQVSCSLQAPSALNETFSAIAGSNPPAQNFTIGVSGNCAGSVSISPTVTLASGSGWLAVGPASAQASPAAAASFAVNVSAAKLPAGTYTGTISLAANNGSTSLVNSPQSVKVTLTVTDPASISASPTSISANVTTGTSTQAISLSNGGGAALKWNAVLAKNAPAWISLSTPSGNLAGGASGTITLVMNASGVAGGKSYATSVTVNATDPTTGRPVVGSPITIAVAVNVAAPALQVSTNSLAYTANQGGSNPGTQAILLTNTGGDVLGWSAGKPSQSWLSVTPGSGSDVSQATSSLAFPATITGLSPGGYTATVVISPSVGAPVTITVILTINPGPTPTPTPTPTPPPQPTPTPTSPPTPAPTEAPVVTPSPSPMVTSQPEATPSPISSSDVRSSSPSSGGKKPGHMRKA